MSRSKLDDNGICGFLVHALSEDAKAFASRLGLNPSHLEPMTPMATVSDLRAALTAERRLSEKRGGRGGAIHNQTASDVIVQT